MGRVRNSVKGYYWGRLITYFLTCCLIFSTSLPVVQAEVVLDGSAIRGTIDVTPLSGGTSQTINATDRAIGHFSDFDIATGHIVDCVQTSDSHSALFRVTSGGRTEIFGQFNANSNIYLINTAGILFARGSEINVNRLVASGLDMDNAAFDAVLDDPITNKMEFTSGSGEVENRGTIFGNSVYLVGDKIYNLGPIIARDGLIVMAAGDQVRFFQDGSDVSVVSGPGDTVPDIRTSSIVSASNGTIVLAAGDTFSRAIRNAGIIDATGGTVTARAARVENYGKILADARSTTSGDGGSITLTGTEEVIIGPDKLGNTGMVSANAGVNGTGGTITIESEGTTEFEGNVNIQENSLVSARGGSVSGDGGLIKITGETFTIGGDIDASPASTDFEPGTLMIDPSSVTIASGQNPTDLDPPAIPDDNTLYEVDIENLSDKGTSVVVYADDSITVEDIDDGSIKGSFGNIELHTTGVDSSVTFDDNTDTIRTTLGDIAMGSGSGGLNIGNLVTGEDGLGTEPGQILLGADQEGDITTGDITTGDLIIEGGSGHAEINVTASGELTVNGDVIVGRTSAIDNIPEGSDAEAMIYLKAGDHANINQQVSAFADATNPGNSKANIEISAGTNNAVEGDAFINGNVLADASASDGTAEAIVKVEAWGKIEFAEGVELHATADDKAAEATEQTNYEDDEDPEPYESGDHAQIIIKAENKTLTGFPDIFPDNHMGSLIEGEVLSNDLGPADKAELDTGPSHAASFTLNEDGTFSYTPKAGYVGDDTFTYRAVSETGEEQTEPILVTITIGNNLPTAENDTVTTRTSETVTGNVLTNDIDPDNDSLFVVLNGTAPEHGTLTLNEDGSFTYISDDGFVGEDSFTYELTDGQLDELDNPVVVTGTATITVDEQLIYIPPAPLPERIEFEISGYPALAKWVAEELGVDERLIDIWMVNTLASSRKIHPVDTYARLKAAAIILKDSDGVYIGALTQVINEFASSLTPPTEEQMSSIAEAIALNGRDDSHYALAGKYLRALADYIGILNREMGFSSIESVQFVTDKYINRLAGDENVGVTTFLTASASALAE